MTVTPFSQGIIDRWLRETFEKVDTNEHEDPNYYAYEPQVLITSSRLLTFNIGTGHQLLKGVFTACEAADKEVIIVTCFWAKSQSRDDVIALLHKLSDKAVRRGKGKINVRICFSSFSIWQKLMQTWKTKGAIYSPSSYWFSAWRRLGLPPPGSLPGLNLVVKSIFSGPFSVMHPKFVIIDRKRAFLPSCNVSWEPWLEGCIEMEGKVVKGLFQFWDNFWSRAGPSLPESYLELDYGVVEDTQALEIPPATTIFHSSLSTLPPARVRTIVLPSPHHSGINPFSPQNCLLMAEKIVFPTPLNLFLLEIFNSAQTTVFVQTPNVTSQPVLDALHSALRRGVDVRIITSSKLMIIEQLVTARTITEVKLSQLRRKHRKLMKAYRINAAEDPEAQMIKPGKLTIGYYHPKKGVDRKKEKEEPVKSHFKLTVVDDEIVVLGSGNMDRASWYTSQELGVAFFSDELAAEIMQGATSCLKGRVRYLRCDNGEET
ncbi:phospholipase d [Phlyctema vagabunda]|uniref:Phospholipase d n=1 Tax=Phlyctema vagabunda TaxID=108571 RepID=A0ABR4PBD2_9HELO